MPTNSPTPATEMLCALLRGMPDLPLAAAELLAAHWHKPVDLKRHDFLIRPGQSEQQLYFVVEGTLRIFLPLAAEEICVGFGYPGTMLCSFPSFVAGQPSAYAIQALRRCQLLAISRGTFLELLKSEPDLARFWRAELERALLGRIEREIDLLLPEPRHRLDRLRARSPHLFQLVARKYIASYLRMSPETLSRLG